MLHKKGGGVSLSWIINAKRDLPGCGVNRAAISVHVREWPRSEEGRRLLAGLE